MFLFFLQRIVNRKISMLSNYNNSFLILLKYWTLNIFWKIFWYWFWYGLNFNLIGNITRENQSIPKFFSNILLMVIKFVSFKLIQNTFFDYKNKIFILTALFSWLYSTNELWIYLGYQEAFFLNIHILLVWWNSEIVKIRSKKEIKLTKITKTIHLGLNNCNTHFSSHQFSSLSIFFTKWFSSYNFIAYLIWKKKFYCNKNSI